MSFCSIRNMAG